MRGIINHSILKGIKRGSKMKTIKRYLSIYYNIKISHRAFVTRYGTIKRKISSTL